MITRHHIVLSLLGALIVCSSFIFSSPVSVLFICAGSVIGAIIPDIHMSRPKRSVLLVPAWVIVQIPRRFCMSVLCRIYAITGYPIEDPAGKRLTHSLPGILFIGVCAYLALSLPIFLAPPVIAGDAALFLCGMFLGMGMHLAQDICTRKGICLLFPFHRNKMAGSIRPCDFDDPRIAWFHIQHAMVLLLIFAVDTSGILPSFLLVPVSVAGLVLAVGVMIGFSDVTFLEEHGTPGWAMAAPSQSPGRL